MAMLHGEPTFQF